MSRVALVRSAVSVGFDGVIIEVESDAAQGLPGFSIVGLGNKAIDEARERVRSAIRNSRLEFPAKKLTINLAPAEIQKDGTHLDVAIALSILVTSGQLQPQEVSDALFIGELALDGSIRPVRGVIAFAETAKHAGLSTAYLPKANAAQASLVEGVEIVGIGSLFELFLHLKQEQLLASITAPPTSTIKKAAPGPTFDDVYGQSQAKRALTIAAAGRHNILLTGAPGTGKTMLANTLTSLLPPLSASEQIAITKLHSLAGEAIENAITHRPFRTPHHTASRVALIGGGPKPKPGEISLAHHGVLFLDEIPEYPRATLESLRQPMEDKHISISRAHGHVSYPADFVLVATMNPCPCGFYGDEQRECTCSNTQILAYQKRLSGPLLDRIDMVISVSRVANEHLLQTTTSNKTQHLTAKESIISALKRQSDRYKRSDRYNGILSTRELKQFIHIDKDCQAFLTKATKQLQLSARSYLKLLKVARTIADLEGQDAITIAHLSEALQFRQTT